MIITVIGVLAMWLAHSSAATLGEVHTEWGRVKGKNVQMGGIFGSSSVDVFKGLPFADVPGRWEKPKPHPGWSGVLQATKYRDRCLQVNMLQMGTVGSEDCLYLNIFVPHGRRGAFLLGASNDAAILGDSLYDGKEMADRGGVIVVTVNYRVGTLGFLSTGDSRLPGNYGLWDQHAAISWVHRNIRNFGGNDDNITIFGQSAGAASVSYQMLSPYNKGLFRRAISQSGTALCPWALQSDPMANTKKVARTLGCKTTDEDNMLLCMKMMDPVGVVMAGKINIMELVLGSGPVMDLLKHVPVVDGDFIPDHPSALFGNAAEFDYMAGVNSMDGHFFAGVDVPSINRKKVPTTMEEIKGLLKVLTKAKGAAAINSTYSVYSADWGSFPTDEDMKKTVADIETDYLFLVPTQTALHLHASHSRGAVTYSYLFNMGTRIPGFPSWVGAEHAEELQYLFGKPYATPIIYFPRHRDLSKYMIAYWTNFAKTGDPSGGNSKVPAPWPAFTTKNPPHLIINSKMSKANSVGNDLRAEYVRYWTTTYNALPTV